MNTEHIWIYPISVTACKNSYVECCFFSDHSIFLSPVSSFQTINAFGQTWGLCFMFQVKKINKKTKTKNSAKPSHWFVPSDGYNLVLKFN